MIVHELVANALRHAFPDGRRGQIAIALTVERPRVARLSVADDGIGLPAAEEPVRPGSLGLSLVQMMAEQIRGRLTVVRGAGARFDVVFPLEGERPAVEDAR
jgi:two-component sensor histidine kinase